MTYSVESLLFRVAAGVVNTAARAANGLLEVMYPPRYDAAHIWDEPEQSPHEAAASADPHPAGVADPAAEKVNPPNLSAAGSLSSSRSGVCDCGHWLHFGNVCAACGCNYSRLAATPAALTWENWAVPAILEALAEHQIRWGVCDCGFAETLTDLYGWAEHVAPKIADRIACDPHRAVLALTSLQTQ